MTDIAAWVKDHQAETAAGAGAVLVAGYALYKRHKATATSSTAATAGLPGYTATGMPIAGLVQPNTTATDQQNALQDQINQAVAGLQNQVGQQIAAIPAGPAGPAGPTGSTLTATGGGYQLAMQGDGNVVEYNAAGTPLWSSWYGLLNGGGKPTASAPAAAPAAVPTPAPAPRPAPAPATHSYYTVQAGNTLYGISSKYGLSLPAIERLNPQIANPNLIYPGERVNI